MASLRLIQKFDRSSGGIARIRSGCSCGFLVGICPAVQKNLLSLFDDLLKTISNENENENESENENENESVNENKNENESVNENENENVSENENENENGSESESDYESDNESDDKMDKYYYEIRQLNNWFETIDPAKSLEDQIELLKKKGEFLGESWYVGYYHDNKDLNYKIFKAKAAHLPTELDNQFFEQIFGYTFTALVDKLINIIDKEENQIIVDDIENSRDKTYEEYKCDESVITQSGDLLDAVKIISEINELLTLNKDNDD